MMFLLKFLDGLPIIIKGGLCIVMNRVFITVGKGGSIQTINADVCRKELPKSGGKL